MMRAAALQLTPPEIPDAPAVMARAGAENFPVAARLLSARHRRALLAVYGFARLADELGDELRGDRLAALDWLQGELDLAYAGRSYAGRSTSDTRSGAHGEGGGREPRHPLLIALRGAVGDFDLPHGAFVRLIDANRIDQRVTRYLTWEQLKAYCALSANPVGELVLAIFDSYTPERVALSDRVCTGLQLAEHLQDLGEDLLRGRIYLPEQDLVRFGCSHEQLARLHPIGGEDGDSMGTLGELAARSAIDPGIAVGLREAVAFEVDRARELLWAGAPLAASMRGRAKLAVASFAAGGLAALQEIERARFEVLAGVSGASRAAFARMLAFVLMGARGKTAA